MGTRFATTEESTLADQIKGAVLNLTPDGGATEADNLYGKNSDDIPARVMRSPAAVRLNAAPAHFPAVAYWALVESRDMGIPMWKVLPGLITDIPTVDELVQRIITEAAKVLASNAAKFDCYNKHIANGGLLRKSYPHL